MALLTRNLVVVATTAAVLGLLGFLIGAYRGTAHDARAVIILQTPDDYAVFDALALDNGLPPGAFLESQVAMLTSPEVASRAAATLTDAGIDADGDFVAERTEVTALDETRTVEIVYHGDDSTTAVSGANAVVDAYLNVSEAFLRSRYRDALAALDDAVATAAAERAELERRLTDILTSDPTTSDVRRRLDDVLGKLDRPRPFLGADPQTELDALTLEVRTIEALLQTLEDNPDADLVYEMSRSAITRESALRSRRSEVRVESALGRRGVAFVSPATATEPNRATPIATTLAGIVLGAFLGLTIAYWRETGTLRMTEPESFERSTGLPTIASIVGGPRSDPEGAPDELAASPRYRTVAEQLTIALSDRVVGAGAGKGWTDPRRNAFVIAPPTRHLVRNTALHVAIGAAEIGKEVLLLDADVGNARLSRILEGEAADSRPGLSDAIAGASWRAADSVQRIELPQGATLDFIGAGSARLSTSTTIGARFERSLYPVLTEYDLVLVHVPPDWTDQELTSELATALARYAVLLATPGIRVSTIRELRHRCELIGLEVVGLVVEAEEVHRHRFKWPEPVRSILSRDGD